MTTFSCTAVNSSGIGLNGRKQQYIVLSDSCLQSSIYTDTEEVYLDNWDSVNSVKSSTRTVYIVNINTAYNFATPTQYIVQPWAQFIVLVESLFGRQIVCK